LERYRLIASFLILDFGVYLVKPSHGAMKVHRVTRNTPTTSSSAAAALHQAQDAIKKVRKGNEGYDGREQDKAGEGGQSEVIGERGRNLKGMMPDYTFVGSFECRFDLPDLHRLGIALHESTPLARTANLRTRSIHQYG